MTSRQVPDVGDTFTVVKTWEYRKWQWLPFPWYARRVIRDESSYRVTGWLRRRQPRSVPAPATEAEAAVQRIMAQLRDEGQIPPPRGFGPDDVPLEHCLREEAEYVSGYGVAGTIQRVADVTVTGRVSWSEEHIAEARELAVVLAGEPLL
jgi:hypothetical protein